MTTNSLTSLLISSMEKNNVSVVSYAIIDAYKIVISDGASLNPNIAVATNSIFQACSLSKCLTAYAVLALVAQQRISLDEPLNKQLKTWKLPSSEYGTEQITVRQCLSMTSGFRYGKSETVFPGYTQGQALPTLKEILDGILPATNHPVTISYPPGSRYAYSGAGYMVLQQLIEDVVEQPFAQYMNAQILPPLNMDHSVFECPLSEEKRVFAVPGFKADGKMSPGGWDNIVSLASGGLWSTACDLANFALTITKAYLGVGGQTLPQSLVTEMLTLQKNSSFGLGLVIDGEGISLNFRKNGHNAHYHNELLLFPRTGAGIVIMTNSATGISVINDFTSVVARQYNWPSYFPHFDEFDLKDWSGIKT